jgi:hypothetical protein
MDRTEALFNNSNPMFKDVLHVPWNGRPEQMFQFEGFFLLGVRLVNDVNLWAVWDVNGAIPADKYALALTKSKHNYIGSLVVSAADLLGNGKQVGAHRLQRKIKKNKKIVGS